MITMISLLKRREDLSFEEFADWYAGHADAATRIPNLRRYAVNIATTGDQEWDAVSMLTFDDEAAMQEALDGAEGERSRKDTREHVSRREVLRVSHRELELPEWPA